jgi:hypothetical protein
MYKYSLNFRLKISITICRNSSETLNYRINDQADKMETAVRGERHQTGQ